MLILSGFAVWGTLLGSGPLPEQENLSLVLLQLFMGVVSVTSLSLAAVVAQRRRAQAELERQAAELARSNAELDEFARVVSHDLKAPLRGISSLTAWIIEDCKDVLRFESQEHLRLLGERARRMSRLIDGRAQLFAGGAHAVVLRARGFDGRGRGGRRFPGAAARDLGADRGDLPVVEFDHIQLIQVLQNLIQNGVQHIGRQSGEVVVSCRERDDGIRVQRSRRRSRDPESHFHRIFQMFYVVGPDGDTTGVGLAIVKKIVETHGGAVSVESAVGRGANFRFTIPKPAH